MTWPLRMPTNKVWINGTFDVLHPGHVKLFRYARMLAGPKGQVIVGLDTDERITQAKGPNRPIYPLVDRMVVLASIRYIDQIASFATDDELESLIYNIKPEFMVIGDDYRDKPIIGSQHIGEIFYVTRDGKSSSDVIERIYV